MEQADGRKRYLPEKRAEIMKQHLLEKKALSEVCDANGIHPTIYYQLVIARAFSEAIS